MNTRETKHVNILSAGSRISRRGCGPVMQVLFTEKMDVKMKELGPVGWGGVGVCQARPLHWQNQGGTASTCPPQQDQLLLFSHTFLPKSVRVRGWHPPMGRCPPTGNPGSATALDPPMILFI